MKREDEEYCKTQFDIFLKKFLNSPETEWEEVPQKKEPPDYYLQLDSTRFAVEVTTLLEKIPVGDASPVGAAAVYKTLQDFVGGVETAAKTSGNLRGEYVLYLTPIDNFSYLRNEIQEGLLEYIRDTRNLEMASWKVVFREIVLPHQQLCQIQKVGSKPDKVYVSVAGIPKSGADIIRDLCFLLNERLDKKVKLLKKIGEPKILLLLDEYVFSDPEDYKACLDQIPSLDSFHTLFVVQDRRNSFLLNSQHDDWATRQFITMPTN